MNQLELFAWKKGSYRSADHVFHCEDKPKAIATVILSIAYIAGISLYLAANGLDLHTMDVFDNASVIAATCIYATAALALTALCRWRVP